MAGLSIFPRKYSCLHLQVAHQRSRCFALDVIITKKSINIQAIYKPFDLKEIHNKLSPKRPLILLITGTKIVDKKLKIEANYLSQILYNNPLEDFYLNELQVDQNMLVSLGRKSEINLLINQITTAGFGISHLQIGNWNLKLISPLLPEITRILAPDWCYDTTDCCLIKITDTVPILGSYTIQKQSLPQTHSLALAAAISYSNPELTNTNFDNLNKLYKSENQFKIWFNKLKIGLPILFLSSLLFSYFIGNHFQRMQIKSQSELRAIAELKSQIISLDDQLKLKTRILNTLQNSHKQRLTPWLYRLAVSVPENIQLREISVSPISKKIKPQQPIEIQSQHILIMGYTQNTKALSSWITRIHNDFPNVQIELLEFDAVQNNFFELEIAL